ncbi:MAG: hypothetical protein KJN60_08215 [Boseongicola sp.]|nr:hypothetical protein [Boseongicola sp.]
MSFNDLLSKEAEMKKAAEDAKNADTHDLKAKSKATTDDQFNKPTTPD